MLVSYILLEHTFLGTKWRNGLQCGYMLKYPLRNYSSDVSDMRIVHKERHTRKKHRQQSLCPRTAVRDGDHDKLYNI